MVPVLGAGADLLFLADRPGDVWTGTPEPTDVVAVTGGMIVALGDDARDLRGPRTEVVELAGRTLLPGFRDGHLHPLEGGAETLDCDLVDCVDVDEVVGRLAAFADAQHGDGWIVGYGYPPELLPDGLGPAATLDAVVADRPVVLWSSDHHMAWVNSRALEVAGITAATPDPPRGAIVRDGGGRPVGTLLEEADRLVSRHLPPPSTDKEARGLEVGLARMVAAGLVFGLDASTSPRRFDSYQRVADAGRLTADLDLAFRVQVDGWRDQVEEFVEARAAAERAAARRRVDGVPGGRLSTTTVRFFVDGVIEGGTGYLTAPYEAFGADADATAPDRGIVNWPSDDLAAAAATMDAAGFQLHLHAIGDAAVRMALDVFEAVAAANGPRDRRPVVAHTHLVHPDDLPRFRTVGAIANFEPLWAQPNAIMVDLTEPRLGPERSAWQYPIGSVVRSGAHVSFGSDWPVSSLVPLEGIAVAVTRQTPDGHPPGGWLSEERITLDQALAAYTAGTAFQAGDEGDAGTIAVGRRADLVVVEAELDRTAPLDLADVEAAATWLAGRATWWSDGAA